MHQNDRPRTSHRESTGERMVADGVISAELYAPYIRPHHAGGRHPKFENRADFVRLMRAVAADCYARHLPLTVRNAQHVLELNGAVTCSISTLSTYATRHYGSWERLCAALL